MWDVGYVYTDYDKKMDEIEAEINSIMGDDEMADDDKNHAKACVFAYVMTNNCTIKEAIKKIL